ncbi:MAG: shikimate kinase [Myxococcaceae bacterium]|nr:shikimate kinase [Myxococcaceae bacterium]
MSASAALNTVLKAIDERAHGRVIADYEAAPRGASLPLDGARQVVLVGHRAAGKSRVLPILAELIGREAIDLDRELGRMHRRDLREWVASDPASFRAAERAAFAALPPGRIVAVGGGFWFHNPDALEGHVVVQVPVSFRTYRERLLADTSRPRLVSDVSLEEEIRTVYRAREIAYRTLPHRTLGAFVAAVERR